MEGLDERKKNDYLPENLRADSMICAGVLAGGKDSCGVSIVKSRDR